MTDSASPALGATLHLGAGGGGLPWTRDIRFKPAVPGTPEWSSVPNRGQTRPLAQVNEIVIHESVTYSVESTVSVLGRRGLSTHIMIGPDGDAHLTAELETRALHCGQHNGPSVGIDVVTPYYPPTHQPLGRESPVWDRIIDAPWADKGRYTLPTLASMESLVNVVRYLAGPGGVIPCPLHFVGLVGDRFALRKLADAERRRPGIWSHQQAGDHADGSWPALVCYLAIAQAMSVADAYEEAAKMATGARGWAEGVRLDVLPPLPRCPTCGQVKP